MFHTTKGDTPTIQIGPFRLPLSVGDRTSLALFEQSAKRRGYILTVVETTTEITYVARESAVPPQRARVGSGE